MASRGAEAPASLYETDETAWLDRTAELVRAGRFDEIDTAALAEFLDDMARRDRREVYSRLVVLLMHRLKWQYQPERRSGSWLATILEQQDELRDLLESGVLRHHADAVLSRAYAQARERAAAETGLPRTAFPEQSAWTVDTALADLTIDQ